MDVVSAVEGGGVEMAVTDETIEVVVESEVGESIVDNSETEALPVAPMITTAEG